MSDTSRWPEISRLIALNKNMPPPKSKIEENVDVQSGNDLL